MTLRNYFAKCNRYFWFSKEELTHYLIVVIGLSLVYSWNSWGGETFSALSGFQNLALAILLIGVTVFIHHAGQRLAALYFGFRAENRLWWYGLIISLLLAVLSRGKLQFLAVTGTMVYLLPAHRLGAMRYGTNLSTVAKIVLAGPLANIFFSAVIKAFVWIGLLGSIGNQLFTLNLWFAALNLLPIPPLDGSKIFYHSRLLYVFLATSILAYVLLFSLFNIYSYILAAFIGILGWLIFYLAFERKW